MIQKELDDNGYGYSVHLSLPTEDEIKKADTADCDCKMAYLMKEKDMTEHWKITNENYWDFLSWVQDSILREAIYLNPKPKGGKEIENEIIGKMLNHRDVYFDKVNLAWTEFDPSQAFINRGLFPFDYDFKWEKEIEPSQYVPLIKDFFQNPDKSISEKGNVNHKDFKTEKYIYNYYWIDLGQRAQKGELIWDDKVQKYELTDNWQGRDLDMDAKALPHYKSGVRRHSDLGRFHAEELLSIYPGVNCSSCNHICTHEHGENLTDAELLKACGKCSENWSVDIQPYDFWSEPEALVHGLTYAQAMAFYNWKYHSHTWWEKSDTRFYDDLVPTEEQFIRIQKGESITIEKQKLQFPDPWFRYVIHFYTK